MTLLHETERDDYPQFLAAMRSRDLDLDSGQDLIADGKWQRCDATNKPNGQGDGSYKLHTDGPVPWGRYCNWTDGKGVDYWRGDPSRPLTDDEREDLEQRMAASRIENERFAADMAAKAADRAKEIWDSARPAKAEHPYLRRKQIKSHGIRVHEQQLVVPMYTADAELVNLQFIAADGGKWFLRGGRAKGCAFVLPGKDAALVVLCEGFATGATINERLNCRVCITFSSANLVTVAPMLRDELRRADAQIWNAHKNTAAVAGLRHEHRPSFVNVKLIVAADDDWKTKSNPGIMKGLQAARSAHALIALPHFGDDRRENETDFNDLWVAFENEKYFNAEFAAAMQPNDLLKQLLFAEPYLAFTDPMIEQLAIVQQQDRAFYEQLLDQLRQRKKISRQEINRLVKQHLEATERRAAAARARQPAEPVNIEALEKSAAAIIASDDVLDLFAKEFRKIYVGEANNAKLLYLICTSRLFGMKQTMNGAIKGPSAVGKSALMNSVVVFMPPESVFRFTAISEKALLHLPDDSLKHRILVMAEAPKDEQQQQFQDLLIRELISEGRLSYPMTMKIGDSFETITIEVEGPVAFVVSTTRNQLFVENETRVVSLEVDDTAAQTKAVMRKIAMREGWNLGATKIDFAPWYDYQRWLATGELSVLIPFSTDLADLIPPKAVRLRRDIGQLLTAIKAHALLHRTHRRRDSPSGSIIATIADYATIRTLMAEMLANAAGVTVSTAVQETVAALEELMTAGKNTDKGFSTQAIAERLQLDVSTTRRRLQAAILEGLVANLEERKGRPGHYQVVGSIEDAGVLLPSAEQVAAAYDRRRAERAQQRGGTEAGKKRA